MYTSNSDKDVFGHEWVQADEIDDLLPMPLESGVLIVCEFDVSFEDVVEEFGTFDWDSELLEVEGLGELVHDGEVLVLHDLFGLQGIISSPS